MQQIFVKVLILVVSGLIFSCSGMVYSPSVNLPDKIKKDETNFIAAYERLPYISGIGGLNMTDEGFILALQHSYSNNFALQVKYWGDINTFQSGIRYKHGISLTGYILLNDSSSDFKFYLTPTAGMSMDENEIMLGAVGSWFGMQTQPVLFFEPYCAVGILYGSTFYNQNYVDGGTYYYGNNSGIGILTNLGTYIQLYEKLKFNVEVSVPTLINLDYHTSTVYFVPTIGFKYGF